MLSFIVKAIQEEQIQANQIASAIFDNEIYEVVQYNWRITDIMQITSIMLPMEKYWSMYDHSSSDLRTSMRAARSLRKAHLRMCLTNWPLSKRFLRVAKTRKSVRATKQPRKRQSWQICEVRLKMTSPESLNLNLLNSYSALQPTSVSRSRFFTAGMQWSSGPARDSLKMQSPRTSVNLGRLASWPVSTMEWLSSQKRKFIWFSLVILLSASRIRYSSKQTSPPSMSRQGLSSIVQSSPKLYFTCTRSLSPSAHTSLLSTQSSSKRITSKQSSFPSSTAPYASPNEAANAPMKSEGYLSPISTPSSGWCLGKLAMATERLQPRRKSWSVGLVEMTWEWLKEMRTGSLVMRSQSNTYVSGSRVIPPELAAPARLSSAKATHTHGCAITTIFIIPTITASPRLSSRCTPTAT